MKEDTILKVLPWDVRSIIQKEKLEFEYLQEIRLREGKPLIFLYHDTEVIPGAKARRPYLVTKDNIREMLEYISNYSLYACEQEMRQGFITIEGGHRVGLSGQAIMENGKVKNLKYISSVNIRVAHEMIGHVAIPSSFSISSRSSNVSIASRSILLMNVKIGIWRIVHTLNSFLVCIHVTNCRINSKD